MNKLEQYQTLIANHAFWAGEVSKLKAEGKKEFALCETSGPQTNYENCIGQQINKWKSETPAIRTMYDDFISFEEFYSEVVASGEVCEHCQRLRELKDKRSFASKRLGQVRGAITRIGNKLNSDNAKV